MNNNHTTIAIPTGSLFTFLAFMSLLLTLAAVVLSAYLRLEKMGLGCVSWPDCYGVIAITEIQGVVPHTLAGSIHRVAASLLGLFIVGITVIALRQRKQPGQAIVIPLLLLGLTLFLSILGYSTPSLLIPAVTMGNLIGGMAMLALLWWLGKRSLPATEPATSVYPVNSKKQKKLRHWAIAGLVILVLQISLGAWVSANFAALSCHGFLECNAGLTADLAHSFNLFRELTLDAQGKIITDSTQSGIYMFHRIGALITFLFIILLSLKALSFNHKLRSTGIAMLLFIVVQVGLGIFSAYADLPLIIVTAHNAIAALLLLTSVNLIHLLTPRREQHPARQVIR